MLIHLQCISEILVTKRGESINNTTPNGRRKSLFFLLTKTICVIEKKMEFRNFCLNLKMSIKNSTSYKLEGGQDSIERDSVPVLRRSMLPLDSGPSSVWDIRPPELRRSGDFRRQVSKSWRSSRISIAAGRRRDVVVVRRRLVDRAV